VRAVASVLRPEEPPAPAEDRAVSVSTLELFFDLVFVFTLTQLTGLLADEPDTVGLFKVVLLLSVIWWIYDGYVWLTNALTLDVLGHRLLLIGGMAGFLVMALAIPTSFEGSGLAFGLGYLAVVALHGGLYMRGTSLREARAIRGIVPFNLAAALLLVGGGSVGGDAQWVLTVAAAALLWSVPAFVSVEDFQISASHFVERHGLVVIVALGESIVVLGVGAGGAEVGFELALVALLGLALSASLWWTYFGDEEAVEQAMLAAPLPERPRLALVFGYVHIVLLLGIVLLATGLKKAIPAPLEPLDELTAIALAAGTAMFVSADAVLLRVLGVVQSPARALASVAVLATIPLGLALSAAVQIAAVAAIVTAGVAVAQRPTARR
jgi:low temperature requirement protein LtrA